MILIYLGAAVLLSINFILGTSKDSPDSQNTPPQSESPEPELLLASIIAKTEEPLVAKNNLAKTVSVQQVATADG